MKLFDYQITGSEWLQKTKFALLADKQRLGKTVQSIHALDSLDYDSPMNRTLVICRAVARDQWKSEINKWSKLNRVVTIAYGGPFSNPHPSPPPGSITICGYDTLHPILAGLVGKFNTVIVDEAHYLKSTTAKRTQKILGARGLVHKTDRMWLLTGTPAPNNASELWTVLYCFGRTKLQFIPFTKKFCDVLENSYGLQILGTKTDAATIAELRGLLGPILLRRTEKDVEIELPPISFTEQTVAPGKVDMESVFPEELKKYGLETLNDMIKTEMGIVNAITDKLQASDQLIEVLKATAKSISTLRRFTAMQKAEPLAEILIDELTNGAYQKVVVFCIHTAAVHYLMKRLKPFDPVCVYGGSGNVAESIKKFQDPNNSCRVFIGNINSAGTSISLCAANHIYFLEESWTPGDNAQAAMRCGGVNQKNKIFVRTVVLENSVDQKVSSLLKRKTKELYEIFEKQQNDLGELL